MLNTAPGSIERANVLYTSSFRKTRYAATRRARRAGAHGDDRRTIFDRLPGLHLLALTCGKDGSILSTSKETSVEVPALPLPDELVVDTTEAGDAFMSALIAKFLSSGLFRGPDGRSAVEQLRTIGVYATAAAAYTIQRPGVIPALPSSCSRCGSARV